jgi:hypothetical protein
MMDRMQKFCLSGGTIKIQQASNIEKITGGKNGRHY